MHVVGREDHSDCVQGGAGHLPRVSHHQQARYHEAGLDAQCKSTKNNFVHRWDGRGRDIMFYNSRGTIVKVSVGGEFWLLLKFVARN